MNIGRVRTVRPSLDTARTPGDETTVRRKGRNNAAPEEGGGVRKAGTPGDQLVISEDARARLAALADAARAEEILTPPPEDAEGLRMEKMRLASDRMRSGYYDRPEIKRQIADRLADEMCRRSPEQPETPKDE